MKENNYAFIDGQNLHAGTKSDGWKLDHKKFRDHLTTELQVTKAYIFVGFMEEQQPLYNMLQEAGFILFFKPLVRFNDSTVKGNVDADMVLQTMVDIERYDGAVIVSGDGDFAGLIRHLVGQKKLKKVLLPNRNTYSSLFKRMDEFADGYFTHLYELKGKLGYRNTASGRRSSSRPAKSAATTSSSPRKTSSSGARRSTAASKKSATSRAKSPARKKPTQATSSSKKAAAKRSVKLKSRRQAEDSLLRSIENS